MGWKLRKDKLQTEAAKVEAATVTEAPPAAAPPEPDAIEVRPLPPEIPVSTEATLEHDALTEEEPSSPIFDFSGQAFTPVMQAPNHALPEEDPLFAPMPEPFVMGEAAADPIFHTQDHVDAPLFLNENEEEAHNVEKSESYKPSAFDAFTPYSLDSPQTETVVQPPPQINDPMPMPPISHASMPPVVSGPAEEESHFDDLVSQVVDLTEAKSAAPETVTPEPPGINREAIAPGLVSVPSETGIPRVAPFIMDASTAAAADTDPIVQGELILRMGHLSATFPVTKDVTTIGRPDSLVQHYPDIEIELDDAVSRRHAEVRRRAGQYFIVDVGSTNGTMLNGELLTPNQEMLLAHGDHIRLGDRTEILFE